MTSPLVLCDACSRHLRADETRCPFCGAARAAQELAYAPVPRMSRAALAALGAMLTVVPAASLLDLDDADAQPRRHQPSIRPLYGLPPRPLPPQPPPARDAGAPHDVSAPHDGGRDAGAPPDAATPPSRLPPRPPEQIPVPLYGIPPKTG